MAQRWVATGFGGPEVLELVEYEVPPPGAGEVTIEVRAVGMNPADYKRFAAGPNNDESALPLPIGFEVSGTLAELSPGTTIASGNGAIGDAVLAFRISGGYADRVTVSAKAVFAKPASLDYPQAANLLLAGATAAEMLSVAGVVAGDTIVVHGASGAVGVSVLQQARALGIRAIGTAGEHNFDLVRRFGGVPVSYGGGLEERLRGQSPGGYVAALDTVGTDEAIDTSLALIADRERIVSIAAFGRAEAEGYRVLGGSMPASARFRDAVRPRLIELATGGQLMVPMGRTFPFREAREAVELLRSGHPGGKLALLP